MGVAFGVYMAITGMTRDARAMGALVTVIMAVALAYTLLAAARSAVNPLSAPARMAAYAGVAGLGVTAAATVGYAAFSEIPEPEVPSFDFEGYDFNMPDIPTAQGGMRVVTGDGPQLITAHPGEQISSANKESSGTGTIIDARNSIFLDWDSFIARAREEMGVLDVKEIRRSR